MRLAVVFVVALAFAAQASASSAPTLEPAASWVAGAPATVDCAPMPDIDTGEQTGYALVDQHTVVLSSRMCGLLSRRLARRPTDDYDLAEALLTLAHESTHLRGVVDESQTDCAALRSLPGMAGRFFGFRTWRSRHDLMLLAWDLHYQRPPQYTTAC